VLPGMLSGTLPILLLWTTTPSSAGELPTVPMT
jgi:hypothetical protein